MNECMWLTVCKLKESQHKKDNIKPCFKKSTRNNAMHRIKAILKRDVHANGPNVRFIMAP